MIPLKDRPHAIHLRSIFRRNTVCGRLVTEVYAVTEKADKCTCKNCNRLNEKRVWFTVNRRKR